MTPSSTAAFTARCRSPRRGRRAATGGRNDARERRIVRAPPKWSISDAEFGSGGRTNPGHSIARMTFVLAALVVAGSLAAEDAFRPTPDVRSFAQQVAHVADDQYNLCSPARGEKRNAYTAIEDSLS